MSVFFKKTIAASLILGLVFPLTGQAANITLNAGVTITNDNPSRKNAPASQNLKASENTTPRTNLNNVAPIYSKQSGRRVTTTTPQIDLLGQKKEGRWSFSLARNNEIGNGLIKYDATKPKCPPAPTINEYTTNKDYYTSNGLSNPWPRGLNGEWANDIIYFENDDPFLCRDQITIDSKAYVQRNYVPNNCSNLSYDEDKKDCNASKSGKSTTLTLPLDQMSGCKRTDTVSVSDYKVKQDFYIFDKVDNNTLCFSPEAKIDKVPPVISNLQAEHVGLGLPKEPLSTNNWSPTKYRADDGPLLLNVDFKDADTNATSGRSGLNWKPLMSSPAIDLLKKNIRSAQNQLNIYKRDIPSVEIDIILKRNDILKTLAAIQKTKVTNNLIHQISSDVNVDTNFFMQAVNSLVPGSKQLANINIDDSGLANIKSILNRSKFDGVSNIGTYRSNMNSISYDLINKHKGDYTTEFSPLISQAQITAVGKFQSLAAITREFNGYYNQWQIDKTKNYSNISPTWNQDILNRDQTLSSVNNDFQSRLKAYNSGDLLTLSQKLKDIIPNNQLLSILTDTDSKSVDHLADQTVTIKSIEQSNKIIQDTINYLNNFNNNTDTFNNNTVSKLENILTSTSNNILGIRGDLRDTKTLGSLANSLHRMSVMEDTGELNQLITVENKNLRGLQAQLVTEKGVMGILETNLKTKTEAIVALENSILTMRSNLEALTTPQKTIFNAFKNAMHTKLNTQNITHIEIQRTNSANNKIQQFFPPSIEPNNGNNYIWDINSFKFEGEATPIFTVAGNYKISVVVFDKATNKSVKSAYIRVYPTNLEINVNNNCNSASSIPYADNTETCNLILSQLDRFGNRVQANKKIKIMVRDQDVNGSYDLVKSLGNNFVNGLRFSGGSNSGKQNIFTWKPNNQASKTIQLKSLLPTLDITAYGADPNYAIGYDISNGVDVAFVLKHPNIGLRGETLGTPNIDTLNLPVRFKSWINLKAKGSQGAFTNRGWNPPIAKPFSVYVEADTKASKKLPTDFVVNVTGFVGSSYEFNTQNLAKPGQTITFNNVNATYAESSENNGQPAPLKTTINSISALSSQQSSRALFIPKVTYQVSNKNIILPGIPAGSCLDNNPANCFVINPPVEKVDINVSNAASDEPGNLTFTINLSAPLHQALTVYLKAEHITTQNGDFVMPTQNFVTIPAGSLSSSFTVAVPKYQTGEVEANETMRLKVQNVDKPQLVNQSTPGIGTIYDHDNALHINSPSTSTSASTSTGPSTSTSASPSTNIATIEGARCMFSFSIDRPATQDIVINTQYGSPSDTAQGGIGNDYDNHNGVFTIPAGQTKIMVPVQTYDDNIAESAENFTLVVQNVQGGNLSALATEAACTIEDNDIEPNIYLSNTTVNEGDSAPITVTLGENTKSGRPDNEDVVVRLRTYEINSATLNNATKDLDYVHKTFDVLIPANQKSVTVTPSNGIVTKADTLIEGDEYLGVEIVGIPNGAKVGARDAKALITIRDKSELPPKPSIVSITGETGYEITPTDTVKFTVTLDTKNNTGAPINLTLNLEDDTATGGTGQDYNNTPVTVSIPNGAKFGVSTPIEIYNDNIIEETEFFKGVVASGSVSPSGALIGTFPTGTASIEDKNVPPIDITIEDSLACESIGCANSKDNVMNFEVRLSRPHLDTTNPLVVSFQPSKVTPMANDYFVAGTYTATFNYLDRVAQLQPVPLINNIDVDGDKEFEMHFKAVESNHASLIGDTSDIAKGTIQDDDKNIIAPTGPEPKILIGNAQGKEGSPVAIDVSLTEKALDTTTVTIENVDGSATSSDYICPSMGTTLTFPKGEKGPLSIDCILRADILNNESDETFTLKVGSYTGTIKAGGSADTGIVTIANVIIPVNTPIPSNSTTVNTTPNQGSSTTVQNPTTPVVTPIPSNSTTVNTTPNQGSSTTVQNPTTPVVTPIYPSIIVGNAIEKEGNTVHIPIALSSPALSTSNIKIETINMTTNNNDYSCPSAPIKFMAGEIGPKNIACDLKTDSKFDEIDEQFKVSATSINGSLNTNGEPRQGIVTILNVGAIAPGVKPEIIITDDSETEGNSSIIKVGLTSPAVDETTITLTTRNISTENADYSCLPEELTVIFGVGEMEAQNVQCDLIIDKVNEPDEQFEIGVGSVTGTIKPGGDNDKGLITIMNYQTLDLVMEKPPVFMENLAGGVAEFVVKLKDNGQPLKANQILERPLTFTFAPSDLNTGYGFAKGGSNFSINGIDYKNAIQTVNLEPGKGFGKTAYTLGVDINNDSIIEFNPDVHSSPENEQESFGINLSTANDNVSSIIKHNAIIEDEDATSCADKPQVKVVDDSRIEGEDLQFYVALDRSLCPGQSVTLNFETADNSAKAPGDYQAKTISLTFKNDRSGKPPSQMIRVSTIDDTEDENDESLYLKYLGSTPSNLINRVERFSVRPSDASHQNRGSVSVNGIAAIGRLADNDTAQTPSPTITIGDTVASEGEDLLYEVKLSETNKGETIEATFEATPGDPNTTTADFSSSQIENGKVLATMVIKSGEQIGTLKATNLKPAVIHTTENNVTGEPDKKVYLNFLKRIYGRLQTTGIAGGLGLIKDDDIAISKPSVTISDGAANEGQDITFTISLENTGNGTNVAPRGGINFTVVTSPNTGANAANANEFGKGKVVSLPAGDSSINFKIKTYPDDKAENTENFNVQIQASDVGTFLGNAADIVNGKVNGTGIINDASPTDECITYGINCPAAEVILPGTAIEGQIIADKVECFDAAGNPKTSCDVTNNDSVVLGVSTVATDVREAITRNAYELIRGRTAANVGDIPNNTKGDPIIKRNDFINSNGKRHPRWDIYVDDLPDGGVTYLNGDLNGDGQLTGDEKRVYFRLGKHRSNGAKGTLNNPVRVKGKHTFIIENASLNIIGDMVYDTPDSSLGIMVINDSIDDLDKLNRRGQLTVYKDVKHIVGALFTDGSLVSNIWDKAGAGTGRIDAANNGNPADDWDIVNNDSKLGRQLILTGNILSKNTIGKADKAIPEGPWGDLTNFPAEERLPRAQMYDFNYIRRYVPVYESPGVLDSASKNRCSKVPGESQCYRNTKSFIIRVDPRLRENPPPGFQADSIQSLR